MRLLAFLVGFLCLASLAQAAPKHGVYSSGVSCPYGIDNGCASSTTYASAPYFQDTNLAYDWAISGQLPSDCVSPTTCTVNTNAISNVTALWHTGGYNIPYWDYTIGSNNPSTLAAVNTINDGTCVYSATGASYGSYPAVVCQQVAGSPAVETLSGYDFTNIGGGTGTSCAQLYVKGSNTAATSTGGAIAYVFQNDYFKASGNCFTATAANPNGQIYLSAGGTWAASNLTLLNITCDGNYSNSPDTNQDSFTGYIDNGAGSAGTKLTVLSGTANVPDVLTGGTVLAGTNISSGAGSSFTVYPSQLVGSAGSPVSFTGHRQAVNGRISCVFDQRTGTTNPNTWPLTMKYSLVINSGHLPIYGTNAGDITLYYNAFINNCQSGLTLCHGEVFEQTARGATRNVDATGNVTDWGGGSSAYNAYSGSTTNWYITNGLTSGTTFNNVYIRNNLMITNNVNCANAGPYTPSNPCAGIGNGYSSNVNISRALFDTDGTSSINSFTISGNVVDATSAYQCATRISDDPGGSTGLVAGVLSAGQVFTVTSPMTGYSPTGASHSGIFEGMLISDTLAADITNGWVDATITSFAGATSPIYQNGVAICANGAGAPGQAGGGGCGSMLISQSEPITSATVANYYFLTNYNALSWSNNWSIGGAYGVSARAFNNPGYGPPNNSWFTINCP